MFPKKEMAANGLKAASLLILAGLLAKCAPQPAPTEAIDPPLPVCGQLAVSILNELGEVITTKDYPMTAGQEKYGGDWMVSWRLAETGKDAVTREAATLVAAKHYGLWRQGFSDLIDFTSGDPSWFAETPSPNCPENPTLDVNIRLRPNRGWEWLNPEDGVYNPHLTFTDGQSQIEAQLPLLLGVEDFSYDRSCDWVEGVPLSVKPLEPQDPESIDGSFKIVWGSPEATYVRGVVSLLGDTCTYQTTADGNVVGVMEIGVDK